MRLGSWSAAWVALALSLGGLSSSSALGSPPAQEVRLVYQRGPGAERCPDAQSLREAIAARLGRDPFNPDSPIELRVELSAAVTGELTAALAFSTGGHRELRSRKGDCAELASAVALAAGIAIDSLEPPPPKPEAPPLTPPLVISAPSAVPSPSAPRPPSPWIPRSFAAYLGAVGAAGAEPAPTVGGVLGLELRWASASLGLEARADLLASSVVAGGQVQSSLTFGGLVPCYRLPFFGLCGLVGAGGALGEGSGFQANSARVYPFTAVGARVLGELPLGDRFALRAHADLWVPLSKLTLEVNDSAVWTTPPVAGALGADVVVRLW